MAEESVDPPQEDGEGSPGLPPPPASKPMSLMEQLEAMSVKASNTVSNAADKTANLQQKATRQRRRSRDLEQTVFGMHLTDKEQLKKKFDEIDTDGNGTLEKTELRKALELTGRKVSDDTLTKLFERYDTDKNGTFSFDEYCQMIKEWDDVIKEVEKAAS